MTEQIRWGIISTANIGRKRVTPAIVKARNGKLQAVASRSLVQAQDYAAEFDIPSVYGSYEELLADPNIDAIYNPLPNHLHAEWSIKCAEAGIATLCEKPLATNAGQAQEMVDAFAEGDLLFAEAFMYRFHPQTQRAKDLIDEGAIGQMHFIRSTFTFSVTDEENIRLQKGMDGGALMDVGCYCVNVMRFMTGEEPDHVSASAVFGEKSGVDEQLVGTLAFRSGVMGVFDCSLRSAYHAGYEIQGTKGRIVADYGFVPAPGKASSITLHGADGVEEIHFAPADHYQIMVEDFADALLESRPPRFSPQDAVENMLTIDRLLALARRGRIEI